MVASTKELKRVLTLKDLMSVAVGQVIGAGIMSLMGVAIGMTGRSVPISFLMAAVAVLIMNIPTIIVCGVVRLRGGNYTMAALLSGKKMAGFLMFATVVGNISLAMYALSLADYALAFLPGVPRKLIALTVLTFFYVVNLLGIDKMAKVQNLIVIVMCAALLLFIGFGLGKVQPTYLAEDFMTGGALGLVQATAVVVFAVNGAYVVANLSGEAKNPTRDIPLAIIIPTIGVAVMYALIGIVASGVLPVTRVAGEPLSWVAQEVLPPFLYGCFMIGGAMAALVTTLNAQMASSPKAILQGCVDGWLPEKIGYLHPKFKTPVVILTFLWGVGVLAVLFGLDIEDIASVVSLVVQVCMLLLNICIIRLPKILPEAWEKSRFHMSKGMLVAMIVLCTILGVVNIAALASTMSLPLLIGMVAIFIIGFVYIALREKSGKVHMEISYEIE